MKYAKYQFSRWWPLLLVFSLVFTITFVGNTLTGTIARPLSNSGYSYYNQAFSGMIPLSILTLVASFVMPMFVYSYRVKRRYADTYYQAAVKEGSVRKTRLLLGALILASTFTAAFLLGAFAGIIRYAATPDHYMAFPSLYASEAIEYEKLSLNMMVYLPGYFIILISTLSSYFINCFLVSLGDYTLDQIFLMLFGNIILYCFVLAPVIYFAVFTSNFTTPMTNALLFGLGSTGDVAMIVQLESLYGYHGYLLDTTNSTFVSSAYCVGLHLAGGLGAFLYCFHRKDPSGEFAGLRGARNNAIAILPHISAFFIGLLLSTTTKLFRFGSGGLTLVVNVTIFLTIYGAIYYSLLSLWRHSWKHTKVDLILFLSILGTNFLLTLFIVGR